MFFSLCSLDQKRFQASEEVQRVDSHVPGEEHVELAEPEKLAAVAGHGFLEESKTSYGTFSLGQFLYLQFCLPPNNTPDAIVLCGFFL